jgi:hypothetical protein
VDIPAIRKALADAVGTIAGVQTFAVVPDQIVAPAFGAGEVEIDYDQAFRGGNAGLSVILCKGRLYAARAQGAPGQTNLDGYLASSGSQSVKAAIEVDKTLGGACATLRVENVRGYGTYQVGGVDYYGAEFDVRVWAV